MRIKLISFVGIVNNKTTSNDLPMNRKEFLSTAALLGGMSLVPGSIVRAAEKMAPARKGGKHIDASRSVLISDIHICGEFDQNGRPIKYPYNPTSLNLRIDEIFELRPLPANVIVFGDVAWDYGLEEDYRYAAKLLKRLEDAGIKVTLGLGNHDRRAPFFNVFPEYAQKSPVPGRAVSVVSLPHADLVMLDSLAELPGLKRKQKTTVTGEISQEQIEWLKGYLAQSSKRVILASHHPLKEMPNLSALINESPAVAGYIYGHNHQWNKSVVILRPRKGIHMVPSVGLPATFYGDIGFAVMDMTSEGAEISFTSRGFWWPQPVENPCREWLQREKDLQNEKTTILF